MSFVNKDNLFYDEYNAELIYDYPNEFYLIRKLIEITDRCVDRREIYENNSFEGVCYCFASSIVKYSKMAYDNLCIGHIYAAKMICRTILENIVCLDIIIRHESKGLWKYYLAQSYYRLFSASRKGISDTNLESLEYIYKTLGVGLDFTSKRKVKGKWKKAYIRTNYGWTYKINDNFNFSGLCNLVNKSDYKDFSWLSEYSHGTSVVLKIFDSATYDSLLNTISSLYIGLFRLVSMYCVEITDEEFWNVSDELENIFNTYVEEWEKYKSESEVGSLKWKNMVDK